MNLNRIALILRGNVQKLNERLPAPLPTFSLLAVPQIRFILDTATSRRFDVRTTVFEKGSPATYFFLLLDGTIRVVKATPDGDQVTSLHIPPGQLFGIAAALGRDKYPATAIAASDIVAMSWPMALWQTFVADYTGFATETYQIIGTRINEMNARIVEMSTQHVEQRIVHALLRLVNQFGRRTDEGIEINFPITRQDYPN